MEDLAKMKWKYLFYILIFKVKEKFLWLYFFSKNDKIKMEKYSRGIYEKNNNNIINSNNFFYYFR